MKAKAPSPSKIIMIMTDGFGVPPEGWDGSVFLKYCGAGFCGLFQEFSVPVDARLGVAGLPQSATGQTALFTGVNAPALLGRHLQGFPNARLSALIREKNIFSGLVSRGLSVCFANAYVKYGLEDLRTLGCCSVTTVMTEAVLGGVRGLPELLAGDAVYHDLTRETIADEFKTPLVTPAESASALAALSRRHDLTLFEYFLTDRAGHKGDEAALKKCLREFSEFLLALKDSLPPDTALLLSSDHGNCENPSTKGHTLNPVPLLLVHPDEAVRSLRSRAKSIADVLGLVLSILKNA